MLRQISAEAAKRFGEKPVLVDPDGRPTTYVELDRRSDEVAVGLTARGVKPGDVVVLALPTSPEYAVAYLAAAKVGAVTAGINPRLTEAERQALLDVARPVLVLNDVAEVVELAESGDGGAPPPQRDDPDHPVAIVFTSGTTGTPKGAVFCNRQLAAITELDVGSTWGGGGQGVAATAQAHVGFMGKFPGHLRQGGTSYLLPRWRAEDAVRLIAEHRMATIGGVPTQLSLILQLPDLDAYDLSCVTNIVLGGGPASLPLLREARDRLGAPTSVRFSATETGGCGTGTAPDDPLDETLGVGLPRGPIKVRVVGEDDRVLPVGEVGQICLDTPTAMAGYWGDPDATAAAFTADGAVRTGDLGWLDERGRLHLAGRKKEMYVRGGYNVYPAEVEGVLGGHPAVAAVAVVPRPDETMGERAVAVVVPRDGGRPPTLEELRGFGAERLATYKLPDEIRFVDALPLTAMDKLDRRALEAALRDGGS